MVPIAGHVTISTCAGFPCEEHENPADFFLDVTIQCEKSSSPFLEHEGMEGRGGEGGGGGGGYGGERGEESVGRLATM